MQLFHFKPGHSPEAITIDQGPMEASGFYWLDVARSEPQWHEGHESWLGFSLHERHAFDAMNESHPPYYEASDDYELLVVRALCPDCPLEAPATRAITFVITDRVLVTIRPDDEVLFEPLRPRLTGARRSPPQSVAGLLYAIVNNITDTLLARRDVTSELLSRWQDRLLDSNDRFTDWHQMMRLRSHLRRLEVVADGQIDALTGWRDQTQLEIDSHLAVRFNDLLEHLGRLYNHALVVQHDIDAMIQIYFSSTTQRTNDILQFLAIISAVFLPLNLLAGLFGTNFKHLPMLADWYGPLVMTLLMALLVAVLLVWFRRRRWI